jgi:dihydrodipicolinate synthase/N-acetylneuraminate lyase
MPALTTAFDEKLQVDHEFMSRHARWMVESGCSALILLGSLGEAATLNREERRSAGECFGNFRRFRVVDRGSRGPGQGCG